MTREEFNQLETGDIVLTPGGTPRPVVGLPSPYGVLFPILHRSWTNRVITSYSKYEMGNFTVTGRKCHRVHGLLAKQAGEYATVAERVISYDDWMKAEGVPPGKSFCGGCEKCKRKEAIREGLRRDLFPLDSGA